MPQIIETVVYPIDELSDAAKDAARGWYRQHCMDHAWYDFVYEDFQTVCAILGIALRTSPVKLVSGATREDPHLYWTGFWSQADGACFEGTYSYAPGAASAIRIHAPQDTELHAIANSLQQVQRRNFYQCQARIEHRGRYYHEYTMAISVERDSPTWQPLTPDAEDGVVEALRDLARWLYRQLEREYEYQTSDEVVDETIQINGYTFTGDGERFG